MSQITNLLEFETRYPKLYSVLANGVPVYASLRDGVNFKLNGKSDDNVSSKEQGKVSIRRIIDSFIKLKQFKNTKTAVFTSSVYRRDNGRNLAAEFLMDKYPDTVVFEWPSRNESFDFAYFKDNLKDRYCPLEYYVIYNKIYIKLHKKEYVRLCEECREKLDAIFCDNENSLPDNYLSAINYLKSVMPDSYATNIMNQRVFKRLFKNYRNLKYAIDYWGSARENIIPVLPSKPKSIELQHGLINSAHPGYIYPKFVSDLNYDFFKRTILVYGEKTKKLLTENSVFIEDKIDVIGNPRMQVYKKEFEVTGERKSLILFSSQPYEQDKKGENYYNVVIPMLKSIEKWLVNHPQYILAVKLHPRENNKIMDLYTKNLTNCVVYCNSEDLYDVLLKSFIHITVNSTVLYEATEFSVPTITIQYAEYDNKELFGDKVLQAEKPQDIVDLISVLSDNEVRGQYLSYLKSIV
ncbi:MAG: hypothetical protein IJ015_01045 [Ruminococcus sp.]|nr:hypothetical protein [Ruminococcus sp.]